MLVDTHTHLYWDSFKEDLDQVIQRALDTGVNTIINVGVDVELSKKALTQAQRLNEVYGERSRTFTLYSTIGIHPHEAIRYTQGKPSDVDVSIHKDIGKLEEIYQNDTARVIAVGECGLDYSFDPEFTPSTLSSTKIKQLQRQLFQAQIDLAKKLNLPLIVHCRDDRSQNPNHTEAWDEVIQMTKDHFGIYHCYSGLPDTTYKIMNTNFLVSFAGTITYPKNEYLRQAVKILPPDKIVLETDCPFLPPQSKRGQRNEPAAVLEIAQLIADLKGISLEEVAHQTTKNVKIMFNL